MPEIKDCIVFFCGCDGAGWGLYQAGIKCVLAIDNNDRVKVPLVDKDKKGWRDGKEGVDWEWKERIHAIETRNKNFGDDAGKLMDVLDFDPSKYGADLLWMSPPCKRFSMAAESREEEEEDEDQLIMDEALKQLGIESIKKAIKIKGLEFIIMENVDALRNEKNKPYLDEMLGLLKKAGFSYEYTTYDARSLGLCQKRKRLILVASRSGLKNLLPIYEKGKDAVTFKAVLDRYKGWQSRTAKEVWAETTIGTALAKGLAGKGMVKYIVPDMADKAIQGMEERAIRLYDDVLPTVTCGWNGGPTRKKVAIIDSDIGGFGIPGIRCPTLIEGIRAQGFPDVWIPTFLNMDKSLAWTMVGNAVPPNLSNLIVRHLMKDDNERKVCAVASLNDTDVIRMTKKQRRQEEEQMNVKAPWA